jgi:hypothetical protein
MALNLYFELQRQSGYKPSKLGLELKATKTMLYDLTFSKSAAEKITI